MIDVNSQRFNKKVTCTSCKSRHPLENGDPAFDKPKKALDSRLRKDDGHWILKSLARTSCILLKFFFIQFRIESDDKLIFDLQCWCPQIAAGTHYSLEHGFFFICNLGKIDDFFPFGNADSFCFFDNVPSPVHLNSVFTCIQDLADSYLLLLKKLLSFFA